MQLYPTRPAVHVALAGVGVIAVGVVLRQPAVLAWGGAIAVGIAIARAATLVSIARIRAAGLEMLWAGPKRVERVWRGGTVTIKAEIRNRDTLAARFVNLRPVASGQLDVEGRPVEDREYGARDYDRTLVIEERTQLVARRVTDYLQATDRFQKTIVFCRDVEHAERMRQALVNLNADLAAQDRRYVMRITGDSPEGVRELDNFIDPAEPYPVVVTTSKLLTTGVDTQTVRLIVLDTVINSMTEFKQIVGRGSRIKEEYGKHFYTIMDFRGCTRHFYDPDFDGEPIKIIVVGGGDPVPIDDGDGDEPDGEEKGRPHSRDKVYVEGVPVSLLAERVQYYGADGALVTESYRAFGRARILRLYSTLDAFLTRSRQYWASAE